MLTVRWAALIAFMLVMGACGDGSEGSTTPATDGPPASTTSTLSEQPSASSSTAPPDVQDDLDPRVAELLEQEPPDPIDLGFTSMVDVAVSDVIGAEGGTLEAIGPDGTSFRLEIPPGAILGDTAIVMTPLADVTGVPVDGPVSGVHLQPEGIVLYWPARLTILPPGDAADLVTGGTFAEGRDFHLTPNEPVDGGVSIDVTHFSIYTNLGKQTIEEIRVRYEPSSAQARFDDRVAQLNAITAGTPEANRLRLILVFAREWLDASLIPNLHAATTDALLVQALGESITWRSLVADVRRGLTDLEGDSADDFLDPSIEALRRAEMNALNAAMDRAYQRCLAPDADAAALLLRWGQFALQVDYLDSRLGTRVSLFDRARFLDLLAGCLRFEMEMTTNFSESGATAMVNIAPTVLEPRPQQVTLGSGANLESFQMRADDVVLDYATFSFGEGGAAGGCTLINEDGRAEIQLHINANVNYANTGLESILVDFLMSLPPSDGFNRPEVGPTTVSFWETQFRSQSATFTIGSEADVRLQPEIVRTGDTFALLETASMRLLLRHVPGS